MKTSLTKLSSSLLLLSLPFSLWAKPVGMVTQITGKVFVTSEEGKTTTVRLHQTIDDKSEILVPTDAALTLNDYYDGTFHLTGGSHLKLSDKSVNLKTGKVWVQSMNSRHPLVLTTANGKVSYLKGEFIAIYDNPSERSQILVVDGEVDVTNILDSEMKFSIPAGSFTVVDTQIENGVPRAPTKVGHESLRSALAEFKSLPVETTASEGRSIASVPEKEVPKKKGEIIFIKSHRLPASVSTPKGLNKSGKAQAVERLNPVPIKIYGTSWKENEARVAPRTPASIQVTAPSLPKNNGYNVQNHPEFNDSLKTEETRQPKFSKELESLIRDLKSF